MLGRLAPCECCSACSPEVGKLKAQVAELLHDRNCQAEGIRHLQAQVERLEAELKATQAERNRLDRENAQLVWQHRRTRDGVEHL